MTALPEYLTDQTEKVILQRMLNALPGDLDKSEGSYIWDALAPVAAELAQTVIWAQEVRRRGFAGTAASTIAGAKTTELDLRCEEHGVSRNEAVKATGTAAKGNQLTISGSVSTVVGAGFRVATPSDLVTGTPSIEFETTSECVIGADGTGSADMQAVNAGKSGNVPAGAISLIVAPVPGVNGINNTVPIDGGLDEEDDISLLSRYFLRVQHPSAGGNKADYITWTGEVAGVGGVSVIPVRDGPGSVSIAIIGTDKLPASQTLLEQVQNYIAPPWKHGAEADTMNVGGAGTSIDDTQEDDTGDSVKMEYSESGDGTIIHANVHALLDRPGIWRLKARIKANDITGNTELLRIGIWNSITESWAKVSTVEGASDAVSVLRGNDLSLVFADKSQDFYWNGSDCLELRINRLTTDPTTFVWVDRVVYVSTFSRDTGEEGKASAGHTVTVEPANAVIINVTANLSYGAGYTTEEQHAAVRTAAEDGINDYLKSIAFLNVNDPDRIADNDVKYGKLWNCIFDTAGVDDCNNLLINGEITNIPVGTQEVAVKGTVTFS